MTHYSQIISRFSKKRILVVGDIILDQYIKGNVSRLSPEAPVPVVVEEESFYTPGGAANVAHNLKTLGAKVAVIGRIGSDPEGAILRKQLKKIGIKTDGLFVDRKLPTITKTRVIAQHQQVVRIDREKTKLQADPNVTQKILHTIKKDMDRFDAVIISDYGKGLITADLVNLICALGQRKNKIITVDPKVEHFNYYRKVTAITPNLKETENAIRNIKITSSSPHRLGVQFDKLETDDQINNAGIELLRYLGLGSLLITLGEHGMRLFEKGKKPIHIKTKAKEVYDVTGAGDAVISAFTLALTAGATKHEAAELSNFAAGIVISKLGAVAVTKDELLEATKGH